MTFGERVKSLRLQRKLTISGLAQKANLPRSTVSEIEAGRKPLGEKVYLPLSEALGVSLMFLVTGKESSAEKLLKKITHIENTISEIKKTIINSCN